MLTLDDAGCCGPEAGCCGPENRLSLDESWRGLLVEPDLFLSERAER